MLCFAMLEKLNGVYSRRTGVMKAQELSHRQPDMSRERFYRLTRFFGVNVDGLKSTLKCAASQHVNISLLLCPLAAWGGSGRNTPND